jgi:molybdopterin molybdotransferase
MIDPERALSKVLESAEVRRTVRLPLIEAAGSVLAEPVLSDRDYPPNDRSMMDGVAVCASDAGKKVTVAGEARAGEASVEKVMPGRCVDVMTGASCPAGTEAVIPEEEIRRDGKSVVLPEKIEAGAHIVWRGDECREGAIVLRAGDLLTPIATGLLASVGCGPVPVFAFPDLALITTGHEIVEQEATPDSVSIRDSNGPMLAALAAAVGVTKITRLKADDSAESLAGALDKAREARVVLLTGGVSVGRYDLVPDQLVRYGAEIVFHRVRHKPAKPMLFARKGEQLIFGLPGNPLAAHFGFYRYVAAAIARLAGFPPAGELWRGALSRPMRFKGGKGGMTRFVLSRAERSGGGWRVTPCTGVSRADLFSTAKANCYVFVPSGTEAMKEGQRVEFLSVAGCFVSSGL